MRIPPVAHRVLRGLVAVAAGAALGASATFATTLRRMDLPDLVSRADRVVHARVVSQQVYWDPTGTQIYTDTLFDVLQEAKGRGPRQLTVIMHGGRIDPVEISSPGTPTFAIGDEAVLFTSNRPDGKKNLVGFSQGHMRVVVDDAGHRTAISTVPAGVSFVDPATGGREQSDHPRSARVPLEALLDQVRQLSGGRANPAGGVQKRPQPVDIVPEGGNR